MKFRLASVLMTLALMLMTFSGCTLVAIERQLDAAEDELEQRAEQVEEQVESTVQDSANRSAEAVPSEPNQNAQLEDAEVMLTEEQVKEIALKHANVKAEDVEHIYTEYEFDDGMPQYDVSFFYEYAEYEYEIHAETGEILSYERDTRD